MEAQTLSPPAVAGRRPTGTASSRRLPDEHDYVVDEVEGRLPAGLTGTLYRNGPGKNEVGGKPYAHLFDGDGMLSQFAFDGGADSLPQPLRAHDALPRRARGRQAGHAQLRPAAPGRSARRTPSACPANVANTSVQYHAGNLLALYEGGRPWQLDPDTLETIGEYDFDGELKGALHVLRPSDLGSRAPASSTTSGSSTGRAPSCARTGSTARAGCTTCTRSTLPFATLNHDCALTRRYMVFVIDPLVAAACRASCSASRASTSRCGSIRRRRRRSSSRRATAASPGSPSASRSSTTTSTTPSRTARTWCSTWSATPTTTTSTAAFATSADRGFDDISTTLCRLRVAACRTRSTIEDLLCRTAASSRSTTGAADQPAAPLRLPGGPAGRCSSGAPFNGDHQVRPRPRRLGSARLRRRPGRRASRSSCRARPTRPRTTAGCCRSSTRRPSTARGWWCSMRATSSREPVAVAHLRHHVPLGFHGTFTTRVAA